MSDYNTKRCDECGALKKEANGWFIAYAIVGKFLLLAPMNCPPQVEGVFRQSQCMDLCSESCVARATSKTIGSGSYIGTTG